jgi:hypothetical protein
MVSVRLAILLIVKAVLKIISANHAHKEGFYLTISAYVQINILWL